MIFPFVPRLEVIRTTSTRQGDDFIRFISSDSSIQIGNTNIQDRFPTVLSWLTRGNLHGIYMVPFCRFRHQLVEISLYVSR